MNKFEELTSLIVPILQPYVSRISVFGSYVRGEETPESDIDVLVRLKPAGQRPRLGLKFFELQNELGKLIGRKVDLVTEEGLSPYIRPYIEREKVVLYEEG